MGTVAVVLTRSTLTVVGGVPPGFHGNPGARPHGRGRMVQFELAPGHVKV